MTYTVLSRLNRIAKFRLENGVAQLDFIILCSFSQYAAPDTPPIEPVRFYNLATTWKEFEAVFDQIDEYRREFIAEAPALFGEIKTSLMDSDDACFMESQLAYEWVLLAQPFLETYIDVHQAHTPKTTMRKILNDGIAALSNNRKKLEQSLQSMKATQSKMLEFETKFNVRFVEKILFISNRLKGFRGVDTMGRNGAFQKLLEPKVMARLQTFKKFDFDSSRKIEDNILAIGKQQTQLIDEIKHIETLVEKIKPMLTLLDAELDATNETKLVTYAQDLLAECQKYCDRYNHAMAKRI